MISKLLVLLSLFILLSCAEQVHYSESKSAFNLNTQNAFFPDDSVSDTLKSGWSIHSSDLISESPVMCNGKLIINHNRTLFALNPNTGKMIWSQPAPDLTNNSVIVKDSLLLIQGGTTLAIYNGNTGKLLGQAVGRFSANDLPMWSGNQIWTAAGFNDTLAHYTISDEFKLTYNPIGDSLDEALWRDKVMTNLLLNDSQLYYMSSAKSVGSRDRHYWCNAIDINSKKRLWTQHRFASGNLLKKTEIVLHNDVIYIGSQLGALVAMSARNGRILWEIRHKIETRNGTVKPMTARRFAVDDTYLYVVNSGTVTAYSIFSGKQSWQYTTPVRKTLSRPIVVGDELVVSTFDSVIVLDNTYGTHNKSFPLVSGRLPEDACKIIPPFVSEGNLFFTKGDQVFSLESK